VQGPACSRGAPSGGGDVTGVPGGGQAYPTCQGARELAAV